MSALYLGHLLRLSHVLVLCAEVGADGERLQQELEGLNTRIWMDLKPSAEGNVATCKKLQMQLRDLKPQLLLNLRKIR